MHGVITQLAREATVKDACRVLGVGRSGYYAVRERAKRADSCSDSIHVRAVFAASGKSYGSRRVSATLKAQGIALGRWRCRTLMREAGLRARWRRKFTHTTDSHHGLPVAGNILGRQFGPEQANIAWASDITYIRTASGWLYLAAVMDLYSRRIVGWAMDSAMPADLVCSALQMAVASRNPAPGLIVHSDRGSQYVQAPSTRRCSPGTASPAA